MKNQYFGDINDYRKYGILRGLAAHGLKIMVHWMLTPNDNGGDGKKTAYLSDPDKWRAYDPSLFDSLADAVPYRKCRMVAKAEEFGFISNASYFDTLVPDDKEMRQGLMTEGLAAASNAEIVFFDPDNGMEIKSKPFGVRGSNKYLYWDEVDPFWNQGHSILVYQHFPRKDHKDYSEKLLNKIAERYEPGYISLYVTSTVVFFLVAQEKLAEAADAASQRIEKHWNDQISVTRLEKIEMSMRAIFPGAEKVEPKQFVLYTKP